MYKIIIFEKIISLGRTQGSTPLKKNIIQNVTLYFLSAQFYKYMHIIFYFINFLINFLNSIYRSYWTGIHDVEDLIEEFLDML